MSACQTGKILGYGATQSSSHWRIACSTAWTLETGLSCFCTTSPMPVLLINVITLCYIPSCSAVRAWHPDKYVRAPNEKDGVHNAFVWHARVHHFKKYLCCFSGADAVRWLIRSGNAGAPDFLHEVARPSEPLWYAACNSMILYKCIASTNKFACHRQ